MILFIINIVQLICVAIAIIFISSTVFDYKIKKWSGNGNK